MISYNRFNACREVSCILNRYFNEEDIFNKNISKPLGIAASLLDIEADRDTMYATAFFVGNVTHYILITTYNGQHVKRFVNDIDPNFVTISIFIPNIDNEEFEFTPGRFYSIAKEVLGIICNQNMSLAMSKEEYCINKLVLYATTINSVSLFKINYWSDIKLHFDVEDKKKFDDIVYDIINSDKDSYSSLEPFTRHKLPSYKIYIKNRKNEKDTNIL